MGSGFIHSKILCTVFDQDSHVSVSRLSMLHFIVIAAIGVDILD